MKQFIVALTTGFGAGFSPIAPGTAGTVVGIVYFLGFRFLEPLPFFMALVALTVLACWASGEAELIFDEKDSGKIVIDEIVGFLVTMFYIPIDWSDPIDYGVKILAGFLFFRLTDVLKPFPARWVDQKMGGGTGVVLDDVVAGVYANGLMWGFIWMWTNLL